MRGLQRFVCEKGVTEGTIITHKDKVTLMEKREDWESLLSVKQYSISDLKLAL